MSWSYDEETATAVLELDVEGEVYQPALRAMMLDAVGPAARKRRAERYERLGLFIVARYTGWRAMPKTWLRDRITSEVWRRKKVAAQVAFSFDEPRQFEIAPLAHVVGGQLHRLYDAQVKQPTARAWAADAVAADILRRFVT